MKCLITDAVHSPISKGLGKYMQVDTHMLSSQQELTKLIPDYDVSVTRINPATNKEVPDAAKNLKVIGVCSAGLNHVDLETVKAKGIQVFNAPGLDVNTTAELALSKTLDIARHTTPADTDVKVSKNWDKHKFVGSELRSKTLGILGSGCIGRRVGELSRAFPMNVVAYDPFPESEDSEKENAKGMDIDELLKVSGHISIHIPLTLNIKNLFNAESIARMKSDAVVLNTSRGGIVNERDMYETLKTSKTGGYATDVMENKLATGGLGEGAPFDSSPLECDNFIATPHLGAQSSSASRGIGVFTTTKLKETSNLN